MAGTYDIGYGDNPPIEQGADFTLIFTVPYVLTGATVTASYRTAYGATAKVDFTPTILTTTPAPGKIKLALTAAQTSAMTAHTSGHGVWDCLIVIAGATDKKLKGRAKVAPGVTGIPT